MERSEYLSLRKSYAADSKSASNLFDTTLITLSGGLLIYGTSYLKELSLCHKDTYILFIGLAGTAINIFLILYSFSISEKVHELGVDKIDEKYELNKHKKNNIIKKIKESEDKIKFFEEKIKKKNNTLELIKKANIILLIIGTIFIAYFIYLNI